MASKSDAIRSLFRKEIQQNVHCDYVDSLQ